MCRQIGTYSELAAKNETRTPKKSGQAKKL